VSDSSGSVIPGAKATVTDEGTQVSRSVVANEQGYFVVPALHPSTYSVAATAPGFAVFSQKNVTLLADQSLTLDVRMAIGQATQTITVDTNAIQVDTSTSTPAQVVEEKRIVDLPLNGRNAVSLALLVPGTIQAPANNADQGQYKTIPVAITVSANGSRANQTGFNLDGSSNNDIYTNVNQPFPIPDSLQEFSVQTSNYTARYGGNSGAVVNAISKSGTTPAWKLPSPTTTTSPSSINSLRDGSAVPPTSVRNRAIRPKPPNSTPLSTTQAVRSAPTSAASSTAPLLAHHPPAPLSMAASARGRRISSPTTTLSS